MSLLSSSAPPDGPVVPQNRWWRVVSVRSLVVAAIVGVLAAAVLNPVFITPFPVLLARTLFVALTLLLAYTAGLHWPPRLLPRWLPRWVIPPLLVALAAPLATFAIYLLWAGGNVAALVRSEPAMVGFALIAGVGLIVGSTMSLGALLRDREARSRQQALQFELERATLERQAVEARRIAAERQLHLLQRQIEPHFLFNTLANVQALVEAGSPRAPALLQSLIDYLRASMPTLTEGEATLERELVRVRAYLALMRMRMPDRLQIRESVDAALLARPFPAMALLTLAENAVRHGIDPAEAGGSIEIGAAADEGGWRVWVADTGAGLQTPSPGGTGLSNVRETLAAFYGGRARLELGEQPPRGVRAQIDIMDEA